MGSYQTTADITITIQSNNTEQSPNMELKYLIILASSIATATADARIVFQKDFVPRNHLDVEPEIITTPNTPTTTPNTPTTTTIIPTTTSTEVVTSLCPGPEDWCDSPPDYPNQAILKAALRQNNTLGSLFDSKLLVKEKEVPTETTENSVQSRTRFPQFLEDDLIN